MSAEESAIAVEVAVKKRKNLTTPERNAVIRELLQGSNKGALVRGDLKRVATMFGTNTKTIGKLWRSYQRQREEGVLDPDIGSGRKGKSGRKGVDVDSLRESLKQVPAESRASNRRLAAALGIPRSTLQGHLKALGLTRRPSRVRRSGVVDKPAARASGSDL